MTKAHIKKALGYTAIVFVTLLFLLLASWIGGCAARVKNVTNLPAGVTQQQAQDWDAAVANLHKIATVVSTTRQTITALRSAQYEGAPLISDEYYGEALRVLGNADRVELSAETILRKSPQNFSASTKAQVSMYVQGIVTEISQLNAAGATGIKNPASLKQVNSLLAEVATIANLILAL